VQSGAEWYNRVEWTSVSPYLEPAERQHHAAREVVGVVRDLRGAEVLRELRRVDGHNVVPDAIPSSNGGRGVRGARGGGGGVSSELGGPGERGGEGRAGGGGAKR
jgi:uncharacterized membrane protein YgcG